MRSMRTMGGQQVGLLGGVAFALALGGCNSLEPRPTENQDPSGGHLVIPVDSRPALAAPTAVQPITGGTLTVLADGSAAIVADPDRDRVSIVDLNTLQLRYTVPLEAGDEPGRSIEDADKRVHVALRRGGAVVTIDPSSGTIVERRAVCKAPRGLAFEPTSKLLHVACSEGKLVSLPAAGGAAVRTLTLEADLRDVLVRGSELWVSTFKSAQLLRVGTEGTVASRVVMERVQGEISQPVTERGEDFTSFGSTTKPVSLDQGVAWRTVGSPGGGAVIVHQQAVADEVEISEPSASGSAYGGGMFGCSGLVRSAVTTVSPEGVTRSATIAGAPLPVDVAVSPDNLWVAVAHAGPPDLDAPRPTIEFPEDGGVSGGSAPAPSFGVGGVGPSLTLHSTQNLVPENGCLFPEGGPVMETVTAVAFAPTGRLVAQSQDPPRLVVIDQVPFGQVTAVELPGESRRDTGRELFHLDSGGGIACASCHPEGGEDGHTWRFANVGARRTQALHVGLEGTAPFHWAGDLPNVSSLMNEVFVGRMGGVRQSPDRLSTLDSFLFSIKAPAPVREATDEAAIRGAELFNSAAVGCATCHSGAKLTNNQTVAIDTVGREALQVPSLVGISHRAPFMHTGCAKTLIERFDPACGGNAHGNVEGLSQAELGDLVAYLESL